MKDNTEIKSTLKSLGLAAALCLSTLPGLAQRSITLSGPVAGGYDLSLSINVTNQDQGRIDWEEDGSPFAYDIKKVVKNRDNTCLQFGLIFNFFTVKSQLSYSGDTVYFMTATNTRKFFTKDADKLGDYIKSLRVPVDDALICAPVQVASNALMAMESAPPAAEFANMVENVEMAVPSKVLRIDSVRLQILESFPPQLRIVAYGKVPTPGYRSPQLVFKGNEDGTYSYDFVADPPTLIVPQVISGITASYTLRTIPDDLQIIAVSSTSNTESAVYSRQASELVEPEYLEPIIGLQITNDGLKIRVHSNGCTNKSNFQVNVRGGFTGEPPFLMEVLRVKYDLCRAIRPNGVELEYSYPEIGIEPGVPFILINSFDKR